MTEPRFILRVGADRVNAHLGNWPASGAAEQKRVHVGAQAHEIRHPKIRENQHGAAGVHLPHHGPNAHGPCPSLGESLTATVAPGISRSSVVTRPPTAERSTVRPSVTKSCPSI